MNHQTTLTTASNNVFSRKLPEGWVDARGHLTPQGQQGELKHAEAEIRAGKLAILAGKQHAGF